MCLKIGEAVLYMALSIVRWGPPHFHCTYKQEVQRSILQWCEFHCLEESNNIPICQKLNSRYMMHFNILCCLSLFKWLLFFFPSAVAILFSQNMELFPVSDKHFRARRENSQVFTQGIGLAVTKRIWIWFLCPEEYCYRMCLQKEGLEPLRYSEMLMLAVFVSLVSVSIWICFCV